jgi:hypothetical protein
MSIEAKRTPLRGDIVTYILTKEDAATINQRRAAGCGAGNHVFEFSQVPMIVTTLFSDPTGNRVGGQCFLSGSDTHWVKEAPHDSLGSTQGTWHFKDEY